MTEEIERIDIERYLNNLSEAAIRQLAEQLLLYPKSREFALVCAKDFYWMLRI